MRLMNHFKLNLGFSLVEMAVVLVILGLILSSLLLPFATQIDLSKYAENRKAMNDVKEAIIGFGISNGYLPCPAISALNGAEDRNIATGGCNGSKRNGFIPWATLGLPKLDTWGHMYEYSVTPAYANSLTKIGLTTTTDITIKTRINGGGLTNLSNANAVPMVIFTHGKNGILGYADDGTQIANTSTTNIDEAANAATISNATASSSTFISRDFASQTTATGGEYDDVVVWLSPSQYINRLVMAGQLP